MGLFGKSQSERDQETYERGKEDGLDAGFFDKIGQNTLGEMICNEHYNEGFKDGVKEQEKN